MEYLIKSLKDGLEILLFNKEVIRKTSKEKNLEEIYLSTLFLNYGLVMIIYLLSLINNGIYIGNRELNMEIFLGLLLIYPFIYNTTVYIFYLVYGLITQLIEGKDALRKFLVVGFHKAYVVSFANFIIFLFFMISIEFTKIILAFYWVYFFISLFFILSCIYNLSFPKTFQIFLIPLFVIFLFLMGVSVFIENPLSFLIQNLFN